MGLIKSVLPIQPCPRNSRHFVCRAKKISSSGVVMVFDYCKDCNRRVKTNGRTWINHAIAGDIESYPLMDDYQSKYGEPCCICGSLDGTQYHHFAPHNVFPNEYDSWPGDFLCLKHHNYWHDSMKDYDRYAKPKV